MTVLRAAGATDTGRVRSNNQDQLIIADPLFAVADGMGGHAGGEVASVTAVEALLVAFDGNRSADGLADAVRDANRAVWDRAQDRPDLRGMGTTMTAVALVEEGDDQVLAIVNVGDSRAYLLRDGQLDQLTEDHTVPEELVRAGRLSPEEAADDPRRHVLTRVLGVEPEVELDCFRVLPYRGDRLLLASDGLFNEVEERDIASVLRQGSSPEATAQDLVRMAKEKGGSDNITVVVIHVTDDEDRGKKASAAVGEEGIVALPHTLPTLAAGSAVEPRDRTAAMTVADRPAPPRPVPTSVPAQERPAQPTPATLPAQPPSPGAPRRWRVTFRTVVFVTAVLMVVAVAVAAVGFYARGSYYVGTSGEQVAIYQGRPGGLLWFKPTLKERTDMALAQVAPSRVEDLRRGKHEPSLDAARRYVSNIREEATALSTPSTVPQTTLAPPSAVP